MPPALRRDLRAFCRPPLGVPVTFQGVSRYADDGSPICGLLDTPMAVGLQDGGIGGVDMGALELRLPFDTFTPMPAARDAITVDGIDYTVYPPTAEDDGAFLCYELKLASL